MAQEIIRLTFWRNEEKERRRTGQVDCSGRVSGDSEEEIKEKE